MTSIRLSNELEKSINNIAKNEKKSKSEIIKIAIQNFIENYKNSLSPYDLGKSLFGKFGSGESDNSTKYKVKIKDKINAKFTH